MARKEKGYSGMHYLYAKYKYRAKKKGISFSLSEKTFNSITQERCHFCSSLPYTESYVNVPSYSKSGKEHSLYIYNGIDRLNNNKGYTKNNVVACCGVCNKMKGTLPLKKFLTQIAIISTNDKLYERD